MADPQRVFLTFGGPTPNYHARVQDICHEAQAFPFTQIDGWTDMRLKQDTRFWSKHGDFLSSHPRGYGYWLWKPYLILETLQRLNPGDVLVYADAGCTLNPQGMPRFQEYMALLQEQHFGLIAFSLPGCSEECYTKRCLFDLMKTPQEQQKADQFMATVVMMKKTDLTLKFCEKWYFMASQYNWINDLLGDERACFKDHRHDQSLYSLLVKSFQDRSEVPSPLTLPDETFFYPHWERGLPFPIWATRNRQGANIIHPV